MENETIHNALEKLRQITNIKTTWSNNGPIDGMLEIIINGQKINYVVEVKDELRNHQLKHLEEQSKRNKDFLLFARHIFPKIKEELRRMEISYLEANGNIYLKNNNIFLFIDTQKPLQREKNKGNRAFTKTGLKVLFYLLQNKDAINLTQRELAENTNVSLGTIPQVLEGLKETGYLIPLNNKTLIWENRKDLLNRWMVAYSTELRPKLKKERYTLKSQWQEVILETRSTVWGGEPAADILTNYLRPEQFILYTKESRMDLIKKYKLMPEKNGEIEVLDMFWKQKDDLTAPPLLVYTDLKLVGGKRNNETADKIYDEYIEPNL